MSFGDLSSGSRVCSLSTLPMEPSPASWKGKEVRSNLLVLFLCATILTIGDWRGLWVLWYLCLFLFLTSFSADRKHGLSWAVRPYLWLPCTHDHGRNAMLALGPMLPWTVGPSEFCAHETSPTLHVNGAAKSNCTHRTRVSFVGMESLLLHWTISYKSNCRGTIIKNFNSVTAGH